MHYHANFNVCPAVMEEVKMESIYKQLVSAGVEISNHESDLYAEVNEASKKIVSEYANKGNVKMFTNEVTKTLWYDIPFAYEPWWEKRLDK
jgi:hypothetical protein